MAGEAALYRRWKATNDAIGCRFARLMALAPDRYGQRLETITGTDAARLATTADAHITAFIADDTAAAATIVLPDVVSAITLVDIARHLRGKAGWTVNHKTLTGTPIGDVIAFFVARDVPLAGGGTVPSEALVLGPVDGFPNTRRAPITALEIFVGTAPAIDPKTKKPTTKGNLAQVDMTPMTQSVFNGQWDASERFRLISLGNIDDARAKAKVAFVVKPCDVEGVDLGASP